MTKDGVTINSTNTAFNASNSCYKLYGGAIAKFTATNGKIFKIEFIGKIYSKNKTSVANLKANKGNYTWASDKKSSTWTGSETSVAFTNQASAQVQITSIKVYVAKPKEFTYSESEANTIKLYQNANVTLNRTITANDWNTLCIPFSLTAEQQTEAFGEGYKLVKFKDATESTVSFEKAETVEAGVPYLIKPTKGGTTYNFEGVNISATEPTIENADGEITFQGLYSPTDPTNNGAQTAAGVTKNGVIAKAIEDSNMYAFRAYFVLKGTTAASSVMLNIDGTPTSINDINGSETIVNAPVYNLQGQRVGNSLENLPSGIYIQNGKKIVRK